MAKTREEAIEHFKNLISDSGLSGYAIIADLIGCMAEAMGVNQYELLTHVMYHHLDPPKERIVEKVHIPDKKKRKARKTYN